MMENTSTERIEAIVKAQKDFLEDEDLEVFDRALCQLDCYWHTTDVPGKGLAWCGITLILSYGPPFDAVTALCIVTASVPVRALSPLVSLIPAK